MKRLRVKLEFVLRSTADIAMPDEFPALAVVDAASRIANVIGADLDPEIEGIVLEDGFHREMRLEP